MLKILQLGALQEAEHIINGGIIGGRDVVVIEGRIHGLHGKTLDFAIPSGTVTFSDAPGAGLTYAQIAAAIKAVHAGLVPKFVKKYLWIIEAAPTNGVELDDTGTANPVFGFPTSVAGSTVGTVYDVPGGTPPRLISNNFRAKGTADGYFVIVEPA